MLRRDSLLHALLVDRDQHLVSYELVGGLLEFSLAGRLLRLQDLKAVGCERFELRLREVRGALGEL